VHQPEVGLVCLTHLIQTLIEPIEALVDAFEGSDHELLVGFDHRVDGGCARLFAFTHCVTPSFFFPFARNEE
jgi:hypothetical protein